MESVFLQYMNDKLQMPDKAPKTVGPVITISREYGCYGSQVAQMLVAKINANKAQESQWQCLSNEILINVAHKLQVQPSQISHVFGAQIKSSIEDFFLHFLYQNAM